MGVQGLPGGYNYAFFYKTTAQTVNPNAYMQFDANGPFSSSVFDHSSSTSTDEITIKTPGTFLLTYVVQGSAALTISPYLGAGFIAGGTYQTTDKGITGQVIFSVAAAPATLKIRNTGSAFNLAAYTAPGVNPGTNASVVLLQLA
jgi:hypothetical protein